MFHIPLILSESLEPQRNELEKILLAAQRRIQRFSRKYSWEEYAKERFADQGEIFDSKEGFDRTLIEISGVDPTVELPKTYCAALEEKALLAVSPGLYEFLYPEGIERDHYEKLLAHEIAHRLHIRILGGDEDAMGPLWFYEGFAIVAAGQFIGSASAYSSDELWEVVHSTQRISYRKYGAVLRYLLKKASIQELVKQAGRKNFPKWVEQKFGHARTP